MNWLTDSAFGWIFSILLNSLWEGAAIALLAAVVLRLINRANATTRSTILAAALVAAVVLPVVTTIASLSPKAEAGASTAHPAYRPVRPVSVPIRINGTAPQSGIAEHGRQSSRSTFERARVTVPRIAVVAVVLVWAAAA